MPDLLESSYATLARGKAHTASLNKEIKEFFTPDSCKAFTELDETGTYTLFKVRLTREIPESLAGIAFDAISNLRASLDQAIYSLISQSGAKPNRDTAFPFCGGASEMTATISRKCAGLPSGFRQALESLKPYKGGNQLLTSLNDLANVSKHRLLIPMAAAVNSTTVTGRFSIPAGHSMGFGMPAIWSEDRREAIYQKIPVAATYTGHFGVRVTLSFGVVESVVGPEPDRVLFAMCSEVERTLNLLRDAR